MRFVFIGASSLAVVTAHILIARGHEVVIVERNRDVLDGLAETLDCGLVHGDGSKPVILREVDPKATDALFCLTSNDQANIIASLVGRSLGFARVVTMISDEELRHICIELGLKNVIVPDRTIGRYLGDLAEGRDVHELSALIKGDVQILSFVAREEDEVQVSELDLPQMSRVICIYREGNLVWPEADVKLRKDDEVVLITHRRNQQAIEERWAPAAKGNGWVPA